MSRLLGTAVFGLAWVIGAPALLLVGLIGTEGLWNLRHNHYAQYPLGFFSGYLSGWGTYWPKENAPDVLDLSFRFEGGTRVAWRWNTDSPRYTDLAFNWFEEEPTPLGGSVRLHLPSMRFENEQTNGVLTREALALWLVNHNRRAATNSEIVAVSGEVFRVLESAGNGTLPRSNHHGYQIEHQGRRIGNYMHGRPGFGLSIPGWLWVLAWPLVCVVGIRKWLARNSAPSPSVASEN